LLSGPPNSNAFLGSLMSRIALVIVIVSVFAPGCVANPDDAGVTDSSVDGKADGTTTQVIWFGQRELELGRLKSSNGKAPKAGSHVTLEVFLQQLSEPMSGDHFAAIGPHLFVRFRSGDAFREMSMPKGYVRESGGPGLWNAGNSDYHHDVTLSLPDDADRIEVYMYWDRVSYSCVLESVEVCTIDGPYRGAYESNSGSNFSISVQP